VRLAASVHPVCKFVLNSEGREGVCSYRDSPRVLGYKRQDELQLPRSGSSVRLYEVVIESAILGVTQFSGNDLACWAIRSSGTRMVGGRAIGGLPVP
jgi:hypothetical protein